MVTLISHNEPETLAIGRALAAVARPGDLIAIDGPLGAGKTRLVRGLALGLGFEGNVVSSPTFVVVNEYLRPAFDDFLEPDKPFGPRPPRTTHPRFAEAARLFHVDAYRLSGPDDLDSLGWDRIADGSAIVAIEWAERIAVAFSSEQPVWRVRMEPVVGAETTSRTITIEPPPGGTWHTRDGAAELRKLAGVLGEGVKPSETAKSLPRGWAKCATTGKPVPPDAPTFPFADERARLADLGKWMSGAYTVSREITEGDDDLPPTQS